MYKLINGKKWAKVHESTLKRKIKKLKKQPVLVSFIIGDDPSSVLYVNIKQQKAHELGIDFRVARYDANASFDEVADHIHRLNADTQIDGIMIQLPLPESFLSGSTEDELINLILLEKDVDGLRLDSPYLAATVKAIFSLLEDEKITLIGKNVVVVGASGEVGSRAFKAIKKRGIRVMGVDQGDDTEGVTKQADILISSTGQMHIIKGEMVKLGVVVIDVGSEKLADGKVVGDVEFESVAQKASYITPVPGGVGPMTVISLMENVVEAAIARGPVSSVSQVRPRS